MCFSRELQIPVSVILRLLLKKREQRWDSLLPTGHSAPELPIGMSGVCSGRSWPWHCDVLMG